MSTVKEYKAQLTSILFVYGLHKVTTRVKVMSRVLLLLCYVTLFSTLVLTNRKVQLVHDQRCNIVILLWSVIVRRCFNCEIAKVEPNKSELIICDILREYGSSP